MKLLLLSNSTIPNQPYLDWPKTMIKKHLVGIDRVVFIPYAAVSFSYDKYEEMVGAALKNIVKVESIHHATDPVDAINNAPAIMIGGGNSFQLLSMLYRKNLIDAIRSRVKQGIPYIGWSAGSNVACPSIKTTNDMPITEPPSFDALNLIHFQINPHYTEQTIVGHGGESRLQRLEEYAALNATPVLCLPEGCAVHVDDGIWKLISVEPCKLIQKDKETVSLQHGEIII